MNRLKELRQEKHMTQKELGKRVNVRNTTISMYETDQRQMDPDTVDRMCTVFECSSDYLLGRSNVRELTVSVEDAAILRAYHASKGKDRVILDTVLSEYMQKK